MSVSLFLELRRSTIVRAWPRRGATAMCCETVGPRRPRDGPASLRTPRLTATRPILTSRARIECAELAVIYDEFGFASINGARSALGGVLQAWYLGGTLASCFAELVLAH